VAVLSTLIGYVEATASTLPNTILDGVILYSVAFFINWIREELRKDDPVQQLFAGRLNTSLNLILPGGKLGLRTLSEDSMSNYFPSEDAQQNIFQERTVNHNPITVHCNHLSSRKRCLWLFIFQEGRNSYLVW